MYYALLIYYLAKNNAYILFEEADQKELYLTLLGKHLSYILRRIRHEKVNYMHLKRWGDYRTTEEFYKLKEEAEKLDLKMKQLVTAEIKKKTIVTIRLINKKFDDLTYDQNISIGCLNNFKDYLLDLMEHAIRRYETVGKNYPA